MITDRKNCEYIIDFYDEETQNPKYWLVIYTGIEGTPYEKGLFKVKLIFPDNYPKSMPKAYFVIKIYHLNIKDPDVGGDVCLKEMDKNEDQIYENECDIILSPKAVAISIYGEEYTLWTIR